jgi:hypothetical protein
VFSGKGVARYSDTLLREGHIVLTLRSSSLAGLLTGFALLVFGAQANALTVPFGDTANYWPGYGNGPLDDNVDTIGAPNLLGGRAILNGSGLLTRVEIDYTGPFSPPVGSGNPGHVIPGDLFLDKDADGDWDYVMRLVASPETAVANYASLTILDVSSVLPVYINTAGDNAGWWAGYLIRDAHPYAWNAGGTVVGTGSLDPYNQLSGGTVTLGFNLSGLAVGSQVRIGFAENCANDVLYQTVAVPEPSTALILGAGLLLLARRRA